MPDTQEKLGYEIVISDESLKRVLDYKKNLESGREQPGEALSAAIGDKNLSNMGNEEFLNLLVSTKQPHTFAEKAIKGVDDQHKNVWSNKEISLLGDINFALDAQAFNNGAYGSQKGNIVDYSNEPIDVSLKFTSGPLLIKGSPDYDEVVKNGKIDQDAYNAMIERRFLPLLIDAPAPALVVLPGVGCGNFVDEEFKPEIRMRLNMAIEAMLEKNKDKLTNIQGVHFDPFEKVKDLNGVEVKLPDKQIGNIKYMPRPSMDGNGSVQQFSKPEVFGAEFKDCKLVKFVAADAVCMLGGDFNKMNQKETDEGVTAAVTNMAEKISNVKMTYITTNDKGTELNAVRIDKANSPNLDPKTTDLAKYYEKNEISMQAKGNVKIIVNGQSVSLSNFHDQEALSQKGKGTLEYFLESPIKAMTTLLTKGMSGLQDKVDARDAKIDGAINFLSGYGAPKIISSNSNVPTNEAAPAIQQVVAKAPSTPAVAPETPQLPQKAQSSTPQVPSMPPLPNPPSPKPAIPAKLEINDQPILNRNSAAVDSKQSQPVHNTTILNEVSSASTAKADDINKALKPVEKAVMAR